MADTKHLVVLGASYGGLSSTHYLLNHVLPKLPSKDSYQVILISSSSQVICRPACPRAIISDDMFPQEKLFVDIRQQLQSHGETTFRFIQGTATELDHKNRTITIQTQERTRETFDFHAIVIATGASTPSPLLGFTRDESFLRDCWKLFRQELPKARSIVIAGGGPAGVETAGELGEYLNGRAGLFTSAPANPKVTITLVTSGDRILPALRPSIADKAETLLAKVGVTVIKNTRVNTVSPEGTGQDQKLLTSKATVLLDDGKLLDADLYIPAMGTTPNTSFILDKTLLAADGRILTNPSTLRVDQAGEGLRIYAIGDASTFGRPAVHNVLAAIPILCANIKRDLLLAAGQPHASVGEDRLFYEDTRETQMVPIGKSKGVGAAMGYQLPSFLVWLIKGRDYWLWTTGSLWSGKNWAKES